MVIFNASFMIEHERETQFLEWINMIVKDLANTSACNCRISAMRDANGEDHANAEIQTVAVQWELENLTEARNWRKDYFISVSEEFNSKFGPEAMVFTSIFEVVIGE